jgi:TolB-like protein
MPSLIAGYGYDIFISYRQKDNKGDRWVSEFVDALKTELESTFKEDISVYFDINPHDGLLETHDVDASLKDKLKCLVFIPIISKTYCDTKSFAWEHEFKAFVEQASHDDFGLKVKLPNGNIASRVLPIQIHDLYTEDKAAIEKELGGVLRAIEFIYKEPGVNKPLTARDNEDKNQNKTNYRIQINKVANAIDEIIRGLQIEQTTSRGRRSKHDQPDGEDLNEDPKRESGKHNKGKSKRWLIIAFSALLFIVGVFAIYKVMDNSTHTKGISKYDKSIAVLPFVNDSPDTNNLYFCNGMMEDILNNLVKIRELDVISRTDVESYRGVKKSRKEIAKELGVSYLLEGSVRKQGNQFRLMVQLIDAETGFHKWSQPYEGEALDIFKVQAEVAKKVANELEIVLSSDEKKEVEKIPTSNIEAYENYILAREEVTKYWYDRNLNYLMKSQDLLDKALKLDPVFEEAIVSKGNTFIALRQYDSVRIFANRLLAINPSSFSAFDLLGEYYRGYNDPVPAISYYKNALKYSGGQKQKTIDGINFWIGTLYCLNLYNYKEGFSYLQKADSTDYVYWMYLGLISSSLSDFERAEKYFKISLERAPGSVTILAYNYILIMQSKYDEALDLLNKYCKPDAEDFPCFRGRWMCHTFMKDFEKSLNDVKEIYNLRYPINAEDSVFIAYIYKNSGREKEAAEIVRRTIISFDRNSKADTGPAPFFFKSLLYSMTGDREKSIENLSKAVKIGPIIGPTYLVLYHNLDGFPFYESLKNDSRFATILKQAKDQAARSRAEVDELRKRGEIDL